MKLLYLSAVQHRDPAWETALVGGAVCELRFLAAGRVSADLLGEVARIVEPDEPAPRPAQRLQESSATHQISSADGLSTFHLGPSHATLKVQSLREAKDFLARVHRIAGVIEAFLQTSSFQIVRLQYLNAIPVRPVKRQHFFTEWASLLNANAWERQSEFGQAISGIFQGGQYRLRYAIRPIGQEPFYLSDASVSVSDVAADRLGEVLSELDARGVRLLSLPITDQALHDLERFTPGDRGPTEALQVTEWLNELWRSSPELEAATIGMNTERLELLARRYEGGDFSSWDERRLDALTERVRELIPRVTAQDWQQVHDIESRMDQVEGHVDRIRAKYGLG